MTKDQNHTEQAVSDLPPLPEPEVHVWIDSFNVQRMGRKAPEHRYASPYFSKRQMREYALAALSQVRGKAQEPVAYWYETAFGWEFCNTRRGRPNAKNVIPLYAAAPQVAQEEGAREKSYGRAEVQKWRDDIAHAAADMVQKALQHADGDWSWVSDSIRALASSPQSDAQQSSEKDAERYRWLRSPERGMSNLTTVISDDFQPPFFELKCGEELDAAIDAAIAKDQSK